MKSIRALIKTICIKYFSRTYQIGFQKHNSTKNRIVTRKGIKSSDCQGDFKHRRTKAQKYVIDACFSPLSRYSESGFGGEIIIHLE